MIHNESIEQKLGIKNPNSKSKDFLIRPLTEFRQAQTHTTSQNTFPKLNLASPVVKTENDDDGTQELLEAK